jgi:hypothetical protein
MKMMKLDGINYKLDIGSDDYDGSVTIVIVNASINRRIPSGYFFGIRYDGFVGYSGVNPEFEFDRDEKNRDTVKITGYDDLE